MNDAQTMWDWMREHVALSVLALVALILSLRLFFGIWILPRNRARPLRAKLFWSMIVFIPFFGALAFGALYHIPGREDGIPPTPDSFGGGGGMH